MAPQTPMSSSSELATLLHTHRAKLGEVSEWVEGSAIEAQLAAYVEVARAREVQTVAEIGFNLGYSALAWLAVSPTTQVVSFDLGEHLYVTRAAELLHRRSPGRLELVLGDSAETVPQRAERRETFDLLYVDGEHSYAGATRDLHNVRALAHVDSVVVMDDLLPDEPWGAGPTRAWEEAKAAGWLIELDRGTASAPGRSAQVESGGRRTWGIGRFA